jgi:indolepyruvate ferredoxin oxidoreductase beta subunit
MLAIQGLINIVITGVGGQGNVLASQVLAHAAAGQGFQVTVGETFGASQRGGSVMSHVRLGRQACLGPLIPRGRADIVLGLEPLETLRILREYGNPETMVLMNTRPVYPLGVLRGEMQYPSLEVLVEAIRRQSRQVQTIEASHLAIEAGNPVVANMVMVGALVGSRLIPLGEGDFNPVIAAQFKGEAASLNFKAFQMGLAAARPMELGRVV